MYSIVMVAAMTTAPETPDFFFKNKGGSCYGCNGCYGGGCYGNSCYGSCYGFGGCNGNWGCNGSSWSKWGYGGNAFVGSGCHGAQSAYTSCCGYSAGYYTAGTPLYSGGAPASGVGVTGPSSGTGAGTSPDAGGTKGGTGTPPKALGVPEAVPFLPATRAQVVVRLPANARLLADGQATVQGGAERVFLTPELSGVRDYQYSLTVENSGSEPQTKQVVVRAGHRTVVDFTGTATAEKVTSPVTVALPEKAKLFVDGIATVATSGTTTFRTPELTKGKAYVYEFRAEVEKDGKTEVISRQVSFKGGDAVTVNFIEGAATRTASR